MRTLDGRLVEEPDRRKRHFRRDISTQQVQHDRNGDRQSTEQKGGIQERHRAASLPSRSRG
jgi:hypothetical protein